MIEPNTIYTVKDLAQVTPFGRGYIYDLIHTGKLKAISQGNNSKGRVGRFAIRGAWYGVRCWGELGPR